MKALVFVGWFEEVLEASKVYSEKYVRFLITDKMNSHMSTLNIVDEIVVVEDYTNKEIMEHAINNILLKYEIEALYANIEWAVEICGYLRDKYNIRGLGESSCIMTRDKYLMKQELGKRGVPTAKVKLINMREDIMQFVEENKYPIVIKPRKGSATQNTFVLKSEQELENLLQTINIFDENYIVESFVDGEEYHCDSVICDGKIIFASVSKYYVNLIETINTDKPVSAIVFPKSCNEDKIIKKIKEMNEIVIECLGIETSVCHLEVYVTKDGECIFGEIASRLGGGALIGNAIKYAYGVDMYKTFVELGIETNIKIEINKNNYAGYIALSTRRGVIEKISTEKEYKGDTDIKIVKILYKPGDRILEKNNTVKNTGYFIVVGNDYDILKQKLLNLYSNFVLEIRENRKSIFSIF